MPRKPESIEVRFWRRVIKSDGCWEWSGAMKENGYGSFSGFVKTDRGWRSEYAHRASWLIHFGPVPVGSDVCHTCDNRKCVRPDHLWIGSRKENLNDMVLKGRSNAGAKHWNAKISESDVVGIKERRAKGCTVRSIAQEYEISRSQVDRICKGKRWRTCL